VFLLVELVVATEATKRSIGSIADFFDRVTAEQECPTPPEPATPYYPGEDDGGAVPIGGAL
jgi:hypothetical protein